MTLELDPVTVGAVAAAWDQQSLDLDGVHERLRDADRSGFTPPVVGAAEGFVDAWKGYADDLSTTAETQADSVRSTARAVLLADSGLAQDSLLMQLLLGPLEEQR